MELAGLFLSSFLAATLLPGGSEVALFALLKLHPEQATAALVLATLGNTLGGMTTYGMARLLPAKKLPEKSGDAGTRSRGPACGDATVKADAAAASSSPASRIQLAGAMPPLRGAPSAARWRLVARHGAPVLILAWAPIVGDALCAAAGWLRLPWLACALWMALGKGLRYVIIAAGAGVL
jgi:membrane protein YqaA with SNARE-associated domain